MFINIIIIIIFIIGDCDRHIIKFSPPYHSQHNHHKVHFGWKWGQSIYCPLHLQRSDCREKACLHIAVSNNQGGYSVLSTPLLRPCIFGNLDFCDEQQQELRILVVVGWELESEREPEIGDTRSLLQRHIAPWLFWLGRDGLLVYICSYIWKQFVSTLHFAATVTHLTQKDCLRSETINLQ